MILSSIYRRLPDKDTKESLLFGLFFGLFRGLVCGLFCGLFPFSIPLILLIFAAEEVLFWLDKEPRPAGRGKYLFTIQKKLEALLEVGLAVGVYPYLYEVASETTQIGQFLIRAAPYVFYGAIIIAVFIVIVMVNALKYREKKSTAS